MAIKILTDGSTDIPQNIIEEYGIITIPIHVKVGDNDYLEKTSISTDELYELTNNSEEIISTTQPTPGEFAKAFIDASENADGILCILTSEKFSKMIENAKNVCSKITLSCPLEIIDSKSVSSGTGLIVSETAKFAHNNSDFASIVNYAKELTNKINVMIVLDNLDTISRSGRLGKGSVFTKTLIDVKPVVAIQDGEITPIAQFRTRTKALEKLLDTINSTDNIEELYVTYNTRPTEAIDFVKNINNVPNDRITINRLNAGIGSHVGAGLIGISIRTK